MTAPANYDTASVKVDPQSLWTLATQVEASRVALLGHVQTIFSTLNALSTGWNSDSAQQAMAFSQQLAAACDDVFGSDGTDGVTAPGVLNLYKSFLQAASDGFDSTETQLLKQWNEYNAGMSGSGSGTPPEGNGAINDPERTAVTYDTVPR